MTGQRVIRDGREYMDVQEFLVDFQIGHASIHLGNLFDGDEELGMYTLAYQPMGDQSGLTFCIDLVFSVCR